MSQLAFSWLWGKVKRPFSAQNTHSPERPAKRPRISAPPDLTLSPSSSDSEPAVTDESAKYAPYETVVDVPLTPAAVSIAASLEADREIHELRKELALQKKIAEMAEQALETEKKTLGLELVATKQQSELDRVKYGETVGELERQARKLKEQVLDLTMELKEAQNERDQYGYWFTMPITPELKKLLLDKMSAEQEAAYTEFIKKLCWAPLMLEESRRQLRESIGGGSGESVRAAVKQFLDQADVESSGAETKVGLLLNYRARIGEDAWDVARKNLEELIVDVFKDTHLTSIR